MSFMPIEILKPCDVLIFQLFDIHNPINTMAERYLFTTEGHIIPITPDLRSPKWAMEETDWRHPHPQHKHILSHPESSGKRENSTNTVVNLLHHFIDLSSLI